MLSHQYHTASIPCYIHIQYFFPMSMPLWLSLSCSCIPKMYNTIQGTCIHQRRCVIPCASHYACLQKQIKDILNPFMVFDTMMTPWCRYVQDAKDQEAKIRGKYSILIFSTFWPDFWSDMIRKYGIQWNLTWKTTGLPICGLTTAANWYYAQWNCLLRFSQYILNLPTSFRYGPAKQMSHPHQTNSSCNHWQIYYESTGCILLSFLLTTTIWNCAEKGNFCDARPAPNYKHMFNVIDCIILESCYSLILRVLCIHLIVVKNYHPVGSFLYMNP